MFACIFFGKFYKKVLFFLEIVRAAGFESRGMDAIEADFFGRWQG
jgi:hypothetical protein